MTPLATFIAGTVTGFLLCLVWGWALDRADKAAVDPTGRENVDE